jgi:ornithine--oxo-acid transaminase
VEVRGRGLFAGVEFDPATVSAHDICHHLLDKGILTKDTARNTTRFAPPLIITESQIDTAVDALAEVLREL